MTNKNKDVRALIYCRVSHARQVREGHGLGSQETRCREYAKHMGYQVAEVFLEEGVSGGLTDRPSMKAMLNYMRRRRSTAYVVIIDDISRFARGLQAHLELRMAIHRAGGRLESPSIEFGEDPDSILVENLLASVSQHQREKNAEQVTNRMRARVMSGYWVFSPPVGYRYDDVEGHGRMLVPDEPNASIVRDAFEGFASGRFETLAEVKRFLETHPQFPCQTNGEVLSQYMSKLMSRPTYAGYINVKKWGVHLQLAKHEPLISFETWRRVQERMNGDAVAPIRKDTTPDFPLRGFVACACCGRPMTASWSKGRSRRYGYYFCQKKGCEAHRKNVRKDDIEGEFEALLRSLTPKPGLFKAARMMLEDHWEARRRSSKDRARAAKQEAARIERRIGQITERLIGTDTPALINAYEGQITKLEEERVALAEQATAAGKPLKSFDETYRTACEFLASPWKLWASGKLEARRMVLKLAFKGRLEYCRNEGYRTADLALPFKALEALSGRNKVLVGDAVFCEPVSAVDSPDIA